MSVIIIIFQRLQSALDGRILKQSITFHCLLLLASIKMLIDL